MYEMTTARMIMTTAVLAAVAALFAGGANAMLMDVAGGGTNGAVTTPSSQASTIPYLSQGIGVNEGMFAGPVTQQMTGVHAALQRDRTTTSSSVVQQDTIPYLSRGVGVDESLFAGRGGTQPTSTVEPGTIPYLSRGVGVDESQFSGLPSLGLTGDSALTRVSAPEPEGLTGDSALTRYPGTVTLPSSSGGVDLDWTSFGAGAGMAALIAAAIGGIWLTSRRRGGVALP